MKKDEIKATKLVNKLKCILGIHYTDSTHWSVTPGACRSTCKFCGEVYWQSVKSQRLAALKARLKT